MDKWESFKNRLKSEAYRTTHRSVDAVAIITAHILVDADGEPLFWVVQNGRLIEPNRDAKKAVAMLLRSLGRED